MGHGLGIRKIPNSIPLWSFVELGQVIILFRNLSPETQIKFSKNWVIWRIKYVKEMICEGVCLFPFSFPFFTGRKNPFKYEKGCTFFNLRGP